MKRDLPAYVYRQRNGLYFQRRGWPSVKLRNQTINDAFWAEYALILRGEIQTPKGKTFTALIANYEKSQEFNKLAVRTKRDYDKILLQINNLFGTLNPAQMQRKDVIRMRDDNAERYRNANYLVQIIRVLFERAIDIGWIKENPAKGVKMLKSPYKDRGPWPPEMVKAYRAANDLGTRERLVFELCIGTGQRIGDVLKMQWNEVAGDGIEVRQGKTNKLLFLPFTDNLREALAYAKRLNMTILTNHSGKGPWSYRGASQAVRKAREDIGALDHDLHALRYTTASELALAGCSDELISAVTGQSPAMVAKYTATVRQKVRAVKAQGKRKQGDAK